MFHMSMRIAVAGLATLLFGLLASCSDAREGSAPPPTTPAQVEGRAPTQDELLGTWRPISLFGEEETRTTIDGTALDLRFISQPEGFGWKAYDGCNWTSAFAELSTTGGLKSASDASTTLRGCTRPAEAKQNVEAIQGAKQLELRGSHLVLRDADDNVIGEYVRA